MTIINLTAGNPSLAKVKAVRSARKYVNLPVTMLSKTDASNLKAIASKVFNEELLDTDFAVTIQFDDDKNYKRSYAPSLYKSPESNELCVKFGNKLFTFVPDFGGADLAVELVTLERYEDPCLTLTLEISEDNYVVLPLPLRLERDCDLLINNEFNMPKAKGLVKKNDWSKLAANLAVAKISGNSSSSEIIPLTDLPENTEIKVVRYKSVNASYGTSFILTVINSEGEEVNIWAPFSVKEYLNLGAEIGENTSITYQNYINNKGQERQNVIIENLVWQETEESAQIDMSMFM